MIVPEAMVHGLTMGNVDLSTLVQDPGTAAQECKNNIEFVLKEQMINAQDSKRSELFHVIFLKQT